MEEASVKLAAENDDMEVLQLCHQSFGNNMTMKIIVDKLQAYVETNEVVYQFQGELMEVSNDTEKENKETLLGSFRRLYCVEVYTKHDGWTKDCWPELTDWSTDDDILFLVDGASVLICVPKQHAIEYKLIAA